MGFIYSLGRVLAREGERENLTKSQTGEIVLALTGTDLLPSPQGHKVSLLMHAVKGNLANTVCKRKHQHIASVLVLGRTLLVVFQFLFVCCFFYGGASR